MGKSKKKILFTSHVANFQKFNRPFMRMLREQGWEVHYASMGEEEILDCDRSFVVPFTRSPFKFSNVQAYKQIKEIINRENYDIIHTHTPVGGVVTRLAARKARKQGTKVIYTAHGFHFFTGAPLINWLIYYPTEKLMARYTDILITINDEDYQRAKKKFKTDVRYVPGVGVDESKFKPRLTKKQRNDLRASLGLKPDDFVMIYPAELSKRKRQVWLLEGLGDFIKQHSNVQLLLPGGDSLNGECQKLAGKLGIEAQVHFLGYRNDVPQLMMASDLSVSSSSQEGLPVNLLEALAAGLPIVATDSRGHADLVNNGVNGFIVDRNDPELFTQMVEATYVDMALRKKMAKATGGQLNDYRFSDVWPRVEGVYKQKKKVLHLLASNKFSGAESVACSIITETSDEYDATYCSPNGVIGDVLEKRQIYYMPITMLSRRELHRIIGEVRPDIIHAHDFRASILASSFTRHAMVISHIHQSPEWLGRRNVRSVLYKMRTRFFDKIVIVTEVMRQSFVFDNVAPERLLTIRNFVDKEYIKEQSEKIAMDSYDIAFCGRLENVKQPLEFLSTVKKIKKYQPDVSVVMVGEGSMRAGCEEYMRNHGLSDNVSLVGFQNNPYPFMKASRFLFITSTDEGFGLVAVEADILQTTVLSRNLEAIKELFPGTKSTFSNVDEMIDAYLKLSKDNKRYEKFLLSQQRAMPDDITNQSVWQANLRNLYQEWTRT